MGASIDHWYGPNGSALANQLWGRRTTPDGIRLLETFELSRYLGYPSYDALLRLDMVAPLLKLGSLRLGLSPDAHWVPRDSDARFARITSSAAITINADDWDFMVAPDEMTYRGPGVRLNGSYSISRVPDWLSEFRQRLQLDASAQWTLRSGRTRLEVGPNADVFFFGSDRLVCDYHKLGGQVLLAGGSRVVDVFAVPDCYAADGPGWEVLASAYRWTYARSDTALTLDNYLHLVLQAWAQTRAWERFLIGPELTIRADRDNYMGYWATRITPRVAVAHLWTLMPGCLLVAQVGGALPIGLATHVSLYNGEVAVDARVGLSGYR
jgi:hypothetical protein